MIKNADKKISLSSIKEKRNTALRGSLAVLIKKIVKWTLIAFAGLIVFSLFLPESKNKDLGIADHDTTIENPSVDTPSTSDQADSVVSTDKVNNTISESASTLSQEDQIKKTIETLFKGETAFDGPKLKSISHMGNDGNQVVLVDFTASDNLTDNLRRIGLENDMSYIHYTLFSQFDFIQTVIATAYFPLIDKYGNESSGVVYRTKLDRDTAKNINWDQSKAILELEIIPNLWEAYKIHPEFKAD